jgi:hypothetical protein
MEAISELYKLSKKAPKELKRIALYNLINFWLTIIISYLGLLIWIIALPVEQLVLKNFLPFLYIFPIIAINYLVIRINLDFMRGSKRAYWLLLLFFIIQCIGFKVGKTGFNFELGGFPLTYTFSIGSDYIKINIIAIIITSYLIGIKDKYFQFLNEKSPTVFR